MQAVMEGKLPVTDPGGRVLERERMMELLVEERDLNVYLESIGNAPVRLLRKRGEVVEQKMLF